MKTLQDYQLSFLDSPLQRSKAPNDPLFSEVWRELMAVMEFKGLLTGPEMDALSNRWEVYVLHGQLLCMLDKTTSAVRSLTLALQMHESSALHRLLARVSLGRGDFKGAILSATAVRRGGRSTRSDSVVALLVQLQAYAIQSRHSHTLAAAGLASIQQDTMGVETSDVEEVWEGVSELVSDIFHSLNLHLPVGDPLTLSSSPVFLLPPSQPGIVNGVTALSGSWGGDAAWDTSATPTAAQQWESSGYTVIRGLLPSVFFQALVRRHQELFFPKPSNQLQSDIRVEPDEGQKRRLLWDEELSLYIGTRLLPAISFITGETLSNTYTCSIAYSKGGDLKPHIDREQNALSLSLNLGLSPPDSPDWPLYVSPASLHNVSEANSVVEGWDSNPHLVNNTPVYLRPNDGLLYRGPRIVHYRYPLQVAENSMQVIFGFRKIDAGHCNSQ